MHTKLHVSWKQGAIGLALSCTTGQEGFTCRYAAGSVVRPEGLEPPTLGSEVVPDNNKSPDKPKE